jgi:hypothetical protein
MTAPDLRGRGIDPAHVLSVTSKAITGRSQAGLAIRTADGVRICFRSRQAASKATTALARVGYHVTRTGSHRRDVLVTGWDAQALESRLEAMRAVLYQLSDNAAATADTVIERFRSLSPGSPARRDSALLAEAHAQLRGWVNSHSGIHAPHDPVIIPADVGNALRLRAARALESAIDNLAERHLRVAAHALPLYRSLRLQTAEDQAKDIAIRRASVMYNLSPSPADSPSGAARQPERDPRPPWPRPGGGGGSAAARQAASGFPRPAEAPDPASVTPARPARRQVFVRRPRPSR